MPHIDFDYPGLGEAYRVFSQKHARLLRLRETEEQRLADTVCQAEEELEAQRAAEAAMRSGPYRSSGGMSDGIYMLDLYEQDCEWTARVLRTLREMELGYLVAMIDAFLGRWREENGLPAGRDPDSKQWHPATEKGVNATLADLHAQRSGIPPYILRSDTAQRLTAIRELRNAIMHRDSEGVDDLTGADLDAFLETLNSVARALAFVTHAPLPHDRDGLEREAFTAEALESLGS